MIRGAPEEGETENVAVTTSVHPTSTTALMDCMSTNLQSYRKSALCLMVTKITHELVCVCFVDSY